MSLSPSAPKSSFRNVGLSSGDGTFIGATSFVASRGGEETVTVGGLGGATECSGSDLRGGTGWSGDLRCSNSISEERRSSSSFCSGFLKCVQS